MSEEKYNITKKSQEKVINMLSCEILTIGVEDDIQLKIKNWLLLNKEKKIKFIRHTYIPPVIIPIPENDQIRKEPRMKNIAYSKRRGYFLVSFYYETQNR